MLKYDIISLMVNACMVDLIYHHLLPHLIVFINEKTFGEMMIHDYIMTVES